MQTITHISLIKLVLFLYLGIILSSCAPREPVKNDLETTITKVIEAFKTKDESALNKLIQKNIGLAIIYRNGVFDQYRLTDSINFEKPVPDYLPYPDIRANQDTLIYDDLPKFNCGSLTWNKQGLFCDTTQNDDKLLNTALNLIKYRNDTIPETEIQSFKAIGKNSRRIILTGNGTDELIFTLTLINHKWYLTVIDRATTDCSA